MKKYLNILPWALALLFLILWVVTYKSCGRGGAPVNDTTTHTRTITRTKTIRDTIYITDTVTMYVSTPTKVDSSFKRIPKADKPADDCFMLGLQYDALAKKYFTRNTYRDTLHHDSSFIVHTSYVERNELIGSETYFNLSYPQVNTTVSTDTETETTHVVYERRRKVHLLTGIGMSWDQQFYMSGGFLYQNKQDNMFGAEVLLPNKGSAIVMGKVAFKISLRRK